MAGQEGAIPVVHGGEAVAAAWDVEWLRCLAREIFREEILPELVPVLRGVVREEMQNVLLHGIFPTLRNQNQAYTASHFQLHFNNELPEIIFTGNVVEPKGNTPVQIFITDANKEKITSGPLSTIRIEILVLDGDFGAEEQGIWTEEEFKKHVLRERKDKGPLLKGNRFIALKDGIGDLGSVSFTDNSKWTRTQKFRLGARALQDGLIEERIQEAVSEAFSVNDHRGEYTMKHCIPLLEDEVWRLQNIRKDGPYHSRLVAHGITTVQDFLKALVMDQDKLCSILFGKRITNKKWNIIVQHALRCDLGHKRYSYIVPGQQVKLAFNSVFQVIAARFGNCGWQPLCQLSQSQQDLVNRLKHAAYRNQNAIVEINEPTDGLPGLPSAPLATSSPKISPTDSQDSVQISHEDALAGSLDHSVQVYIDYSNHVEGQQQACFATEACKKDGAFDHATRLAMKSSNGDGALDWNTGGYGTESCSDMFTEQHMSSNDPAIPISRSKWVKLRFKLGTSIRKRISARSARTQHRRIQQTKWFSLLAAVRFGRSIRKRVIAKRLDYLLNSDHSWPIELTQLPFMDYLWPQEEDNHF